MFLPITGILLGVTFGLIGGVSKEEKIKYITISAFGGILAAAFGGGLYAYGPGQLEILLSFIFWSCLGYMPMYLIGLSYRKRRERSLSEAFAFVPAERGSIEERQILRHIPKVNSKLEIRRKWFFGFNVVIPFTIKNTTQIEIDDLKAILKIKDRTLRRKEKIVIKDLVNLFPEETKNYTISEKLGRTYKNHSIILSIDRRGVTLEEFHWDI